jgi:hypothetical protein
LPYQFSSLFLPTSGSDSLLLKAFLLCS